MRETNTTLLAVEAGRTLLLDRAEMLAAADASGITITGSPGSQDTWRLLKEPS